MTLSTAPVVVAASLFFASPPPPTPVPTPPTADDSPAPSSDAESTTISEGDVRHPDLARRAPQPAWVYEGGRSEPVPYDASLDKKIRRSGKVMITGGAITLVGLVGAVGGFTLFAFEETRAYAPFVAYPSLGLTTGGLVVTLVGRARLKKFRAQRRGEPLTAGLSPSRHGFGLTIGGRF